VPKVQQIKTSIRENNFLIFHAMQFGHLRGLMQGNYLRLNIG
jgi:hypothetical protein